MLAAVAFVAMLVLGWAMRRQIPMVWRVEVRARPGGRLVEFTGNGGERWVIRGDVTTSQERVW